MEILRTMTAGQIEARYQETVAKVLAVLEESKAQEEDIESKIAMLTMEREMERTIWEKLRGKKEGG